MKANKHINSLKNKHNLIYKQHNVYMTKKWMRFHAQTAEKIKNLLSDLFA